MEPRFEHGAAGEGTPPSLRRRCPCTWGAASAAPARWLCERNVGGNRRARGKARGKGLRKGTKASLISGTLSPRSTVPGSSLPGFSRFLSLVCRGQRVLESNHAPESLLYWRSRNCRFVRFPIDTGMQPAHHGNGERVRNLRLASVALRGRYAFWNRITHPRGHNGPSSAL